MRRFALLSRCMGIMISILLPVLATILPFGPAHRWNAYICGVAATVLASVGLSYDRARFAAGLVGAWVAAFSVISWSSLAEGATGVTLGVATFLFMAGPFSQAPQRMAAGTPPTKAPPQEVRSERKHRYVEAVEGAG